MRKRICFLLCILTAAMLLSGCDLLSGYRVLQERIHIDWSGVERASEELASALDAGDAGAVRKMFSYNTQLTVDELDEQVDDLLAFYEGGSAAYEIVAGPIESKNMSYGIVEEHFRVSIILTTATEQYCIAFESYTRDDADENNVGITSLYIARKADTNPAFAYWGDGDWTPGITILGEA